MEWVIALVGCIVLGVVVLFFQELLASSLHRAQKVLGRAALRESLADNRLTCALRAAAGRVYGIGTEWSTGSAILSPGRMIFAPTMGIVGKRDIEVTLVEVSHQPVDEDDHVVLRVTTPQGELLWRVSSAIAEQVAALVG